MAETNSSGTETSLKQLFQSMIPGGDELMEGTVIETKPLKIQMTNDEQLIINERITVVPWHLTDYTTKATLLGACDTPHVQSTLTVHNALRKGEKVHILALNHGKLYYILDRVAGQVVT